MNSSTHEADFNLEELFFSKTDHKGLIQASNTVFVRVSEFGEEELLGRPHNIVRHSDMPKTVFKLFWEFLLAGKSIAAYVKNRTKHGKYYWVFAMAFPMADGFLSIRIKPTSKYFPIVQDLYFEISYQESTGKSLDETLMILSQKIQSLGFSSYEDFMMQVLVEELSSRDLLLSQNRSPSSKVASTNPRISDILFASAHCAESARDGFRITGQLYANLTKLMGQVALITETCTKTKFITTNMTISSAKLGEFGRPLVVVSANLEKLTGEIADCIGKLQGALRDFQESVAQMHFALTTSRLQIEMMYHFISEMAQISQAQMPQMEQFFENCGLLNNLIAQNFTKVEAACTVLGKVSRSLLATMERLTQVTAGMDVIRIVGKIEVARVDGMSDSLTSRLEEIEELTMNFKDSLRELKADCLWGITSSTRMTVLTKDIGGRLNQMTKMIAT